MIVVAGIKSCDNCRKALAWLESEGIPHRFTDFRVDGLTEKQLKSWIYAVSWQTLLNRRSTTWRGLDDASKSDMDEVKALRLLLDYPNLVKRPIFDTEKGIFVGFSAAVQAEISE